MIPALKKLLKLVEETEHIYINREMSVQINALGAQKQLGTLAREVIPLINSFTCYVPGTVLSYGR